MIEPWASVALSGIAQALPNPRDVHWNRLCALAQFLCSHNDERFTAKQLVQCIRKDDVQDNGMCRSIGKMLSGLPTRPRATLSSSLHKSMRDKKGKRLKVNANYWDTNEIINILQEHAVIVSQEDGEKCLNPALTGHYSTDSALQHVPVLRVNNLPPSFFLTDYRLNGEEELNYLEKLWQQEFSRQVSFLASLKAAEAVLDSSYWDGQCLLFEQGQIDSDKYVKITRQWLQKKFPDGSVTISNIAATTASRLVAMVRSPLDIQDWNHDEISQNRHAHHLCRKRNCISPRHLMIIGNDAHKEVHLHSREQNHPVFTAEVSVTSATF